MSGPGHPICGTVLSQPVDGCWGSGSDHVPRSLSSLCSAGRRIFTQIFLKSKAEHFDLRHLCTHLTQTLCPVTFRGPLRGPPGCGEGCDLQGPGVGLALSPSPPRRASRGEFCL